ncbi:uncharacterized protein LOC115440371 [Manduca sexta]|uniref:uncharacterized protein LOC115440371 n=1 Tax=Manduca sexta TaxID=7130 RepID=UPI00188E0817|nr:uncharacterized protein LOC115440371 [Manduca sexta]
MSDSDRNSLAKKLKIAVHTKKLINMVRERSCLWDRTALEYKNRLLRDRGWQEICVEFEPNYESMSSREKHQVGNFLSKKWCNLRDSYVKSKKPVRSDKRPYMYSEEMKFLDDTLFIDPATGKKRIREEERQSTEEVDDDVEEHEGWIDEVFVDSEIIDESHISAKRSKLEHEYSKGINDTDNLVSFLENFMQREDDEDFAFFKSIAPAVKRLSENSKLEFRILVMKLLKNLKMRDRQRVTKDQPAQVDSDSE